MALGFWPWNFQGVSHNSVEFPGVKACFLWNFLGQSHKSKNSTERRRGIRKVYPQPPLPVRIFPGIAQCCQFCLKFWPWCIRYATVFIEVLWNGKNWDKKLTWGIILWVFCLRTLEPYELHLKILPNKRQSFLYWFSIHEMASLWVFWRSFPQILFDLAEILTRGSPIRQTYC